VKNFELISFVTSDELSQAAASAWLDEIETANRAGKSHCVALSGGRIARTFYSAVVKEATTRSASLRGVHFFWADERCVPPDDAESNFLLAQQLLFAPLKISSNQIHRIRGEDSPEVAAKKAADEICCVAPVNANGQPVLDLVFLGIGEDGHVASLFPSEPEAMISDPAVYRAIKDSPKPPPNRVTLGYQAIAAARQVWILASDGRKERVFADSLKPTGQTPLARVLKSRSSTKIFTDIPALKS